MRKLRAILLLLAFVLSLCGCNNTNGFKPSTPPSSTPTETVWYTEGYIVITEQQVEAIVNGNFTTPKNIIYIIGDGMGPNDIKITERFSKEKYDFGLVLNRIVNHGLATTHSANSSVTDSAASATALSTGVKTNNGVVGKDVNGNNLKTLGEIAREAGKKVGIITNEAVYGATPSGFAIHNAARGASAELVNDFIRFRPDVLMGSNFSKVFMLAKEEEWGIVQNEFICAPEFSKFNKMLNTDPNGQKYFMGFNESYSTTASYNLARCAEVAFNRLKNDNGFFVKIESAGTDKYGHPRQSVCGWKGQ